MRPRSALHLGAALLLLTFPSIPVHADAISIDEEGGFTIGERHLTLAQALAASEPPRSDIYLIVGAEQISLPKDAAPPAPEDRVRRIGEEFGCIVRDFHDVTAIAPATMTVLNTSPKAQDPFADTPASDAFQLLVSMLDDSQWRMLGGPEGIGLSDLTTDEQRQLFTDIFPITPITLFPQGSGAEEEKDPTLSRENAASARLRLSHRTNYAISVAGQPNAKYGISPPAGGRYYQASQVPPWQPAPDTIYGVTLRSAAPNVLKDSDLDYDRDELGAVVDLSGVKTVQDLITRIGLATRIELYADRRYETQSVTILGPRSGRARDFLKAVALCVRGTYRQVGPAYVLTNDRLGLGTRQSIITRFLLETDMGRRQAIVDANDRMSETHHLADQPPAISDFALTGSQQTEFSALNGSAQSITTPLEKMSPEQQDFVRKAVQKNNNAITPGNGTRLTTDLPIDLSLSPSISLTSPSIDGVVVLDGYLQPNGLLQASGRAEMLKKYHADTITFAAAMKKAQEAFEEDPEIGAPASRAPKPVLAEAAVSFARRAVLVRPDSVKSLDRIIAVMKRIGLNQLWLDVFSGGKSHLDGKPNLLEAAIAKTKGSGIAIIPHVNALNWGADAPLDAQDLTILGENSIQETAWNNKIAPDEFYQYLLPDIAASPNTNLRVSPASPIVQDTLTTLLRRLAATPGVTDIALSNASAPDYEADQRGAGMGYTPTLRLALLRRDHVDPVDFETMSYYAQEPMNQSVPEFANQASLSSVHDDWTALLVNTRSAFLQTLLSSVRETGSPPPNLFLRTEPPFQTPTWYGLWSDPRSLDPHRPKPRTTLSEKPTPPAQYAHRRWRTNIVIPVFWSDQSREQLIAAVNALEPGWDGFVLDFTIDSHGDPFSALAKRKRSEKSALPAKTP